MSRLLELMPLSLREANAFVRRHHRHHKPVRGQKFSLGAAYEGALVGCAIVGRPVSRMRQDGSTLEVTRLCTDGVPRKVVDRRGKEHTLGICSFLYRAAARAAFALGYTRIGTYILASEIGASLTGADWRLVRKSAGGSHSRKSRPRIDKHPLEPKLLFELVA